MVGSRLIVGSGLGTSFRPITAPMVPSRNTILTAETASAPVAIA